MRPTPSESLRGIRDVLERVMGPEIQSEYARVRFGELVMALRSLESTVESDYIRLAEEYRSLARLALNGSTVLCSPGVPEPLRELGLQLAHELSLGFFRDEGRPLPAFVSLNDSTARLNALLSSAIIEIDRASDCSASAALSSFRRVIREHIKAQLLDAPAPSGHIGVIG